jgi:hypothetical protein
MEPEQATAAVSNAAHHHEFSDLAAVAQHDSVGSATASIRPAIGAGVETAFPNTGIYAPRLHAALTTIMQGSDPELSAVLRAAVLRSMALSMGSGTTAAAPLHFVPGNNPLVLAIIEAVVKLCLNVQVAPHMCVSPVVPCGRRAFLVSAH